MQETLLGTVTTESQTTGEQEVKPVVGCRNFLKDNQNLIEFATVEDELENVINSQDEIDERIFKFPNAALIGEDGRKVNYYEFINSLENEDCNKALARMFPIIESKMDEIEDFINSVKEISDVRKKFYIVMLTNRFEKILEPAYKNLVV